MNEELQSKRMQGHDVRAPSAARKAKRVLALLCAIDVECVQASHLLVEYGLDSLGRLELIAALEEQFGIFIDDEEAASLKTIADVIALVGTKVAR